MTSKPIEKKKEQLVLALYPNAIGFGYAVMTNALNVLVSQVVNIRPISNKQSLKRIKEIINYYKPHIVVIEDYQGIGSRKSKRIQKVLDSIYLYAQKKHLKVRRYSRNDIRYVFSNFNAHTKHEIACVIAGNVKNMERKLREPRKINESEKYVTGAFDAVSLGVTHFYMVE
ncbi:hypothetical protein [Winogradskyella luteola]|uniref:Uncharacterized protein n=1 Tax=Winogradskyella luteola TaxID=2828330 RepID=A0A9X1FBS7_9FLAO|nr:hypothetical protein [Winogradskyella luteola]MBV7270711.1 hypothetical protein [Winogradskyella luteola]